MERMPDGRIVFLEDTPGKGLDHIWERHYREFTKKHIKKDDIPLLVIKALREGNIVGYQGEGKGRPIYSVEFRGNNINIGITVSDNGFIVGANPKSNNL